MSRPNKNILPRKDFVKRVVKYSLIALSIIVFSILLGVVGYHYFAGLDWVDSFYNAAMILTGMGPVNKLSTNGAKVFSSLYALYSGIVFLSTVAVFFAPFAHRLMHLLHVDEEDIEK